MEWADTALVIGRRRHGETSVIVEAMTRAHGRHLGIVRGGHSRSLQPVLQPGNTIAVVWRARLEEHLGAFAVELLESRAARLMETPFALHGLNHLSGMLHMLPERDPHTDLFEMAETLAGHLDDRTLAPDLLVRFELALLAEFGVGLDLDRCALSGVTDDLAYVSPKSGRAVSREAGAPWRERLLPLPAFLFAAAGCRRLTRQEIDDAFALTGHFLDRELFAPRGQLLPVARERLLVLLRDDASTP